MNRLVVADANESVFAGEGDPARVKFRRAIADSRLQAARSWCTPAAKPNRAVREIIRLLATALVAGFACVPAARADEPAAIRIGPRNVLLLRSAHGMESPSERASLASEKIAQAILDPACPPESWRTEAMDEEVMILLCERRILAVTAGDATAEGLAPQALAETWTARLRTAYASEKHAALSALLLRRAIAGLLLPIGFLVVLLIVRLVAMRVEHWASARMRAGVSVRLGPVSISGNAFETGLLRILLSLFRWSLYAILTYAFLIALFRQFPVTARWAGAMLAPIVETGRQLGAQTFTLIPRLFLAALILVAVRLALRTVGLLFERVRKHGLRMEPFFSPDTAAHAELIARVLVLGLGLFLISLMVPGETGAVLLAAFGIAALGLVFGAREMVADLIGGLVVTYGRPVRRGERIRTGRYAGVLRTRGLLFTRLESPENDIIVIPNGWFMDNPVRIVRDGRPLAMRVTLKAACGPEAAAGMIRGAAVEAELKKDEGVLALRAVRRETLIYDIWWPAPTGRSIDQVRSGFLRALLARARALGIEVVSARPARPRFRGA